MPVCAWLRTATIRPATLLRADAVVGEADLANAARVEDVPTVEQDRLLQQLLDLLGIHVSELVPLGDQDQGVSPFEGLQRVVRNADLVADLVTEDVLGLGKFLFC